MSDSENLVFWSQIWMVLMTAAALTGLVGGIAMLMTEYRMVLWVVSVVGVSAVSVITFLAGRIVWRNRDNW